MLYNSKIDTFIQVADAGSFSKAAKNMYLTTAAVMNQINALENELDSVLFDRTPKGITLTETGRRLYHDFKSLKRASDIAIKRAKDIHQEQRQVLHIATFHMNRIDFSKVFWDEVLQLVPDIDIHIDTVDIQPGHGNTVFSSIGNGIDLIFGIISDVFSQKCNINNLLLKEYPVMCAVPSDHPLAKKTILSVDDLSGETLLVGAKGFSPSLDEFINDLPQRNPDISLSFFPRFNTDIFNTCINTRSILMSIEPWSGIHPQLKTLPVMWPYKMPYGIMYGSDPGEAVIRFLEAAKSVRHLL